MPRLRKNLLHFIKLDVKNHGKTVTPPLGCVED